MRRTRQLISSLSHLLIPGLILWSYFAGKPLRLVLAITVPLLFLEYLPRVLRYQRTPYSPSHAGMKTSVILAVMNIWFISQDEPRIAVGLDLFFLALAVFAVIATRIWPDKIWFRRPGEPRYSDLPHAKLQ
jgi:hypothetical protein